jgi:tRNA U54 and U55 pseudouridine synthase Pus10
MINESQRRAKAAYRKKLKQVNIEFYPNDADILEHLEKQQSKATYIKELIRKDMERP